MFKEKFIRLCNKNGIPPSTVCRDIGITPSAFTKWTDESIPRRATLMRIADYFGVPVEYFTESDRPVSDKYDLILSRIKRLPSDEFDDLVKYIEFMESKRK